MRKKRLTGAEKLARAISRAKPGDPGYPYVEACTFLARWVIGLSIHTRRTLEGQDPRCSTPGTAEYRACERTVNECATTELDNKSQEIGSIGSVVVHATIFFERAMRSRLRPDARLDVPSLVYDGALNRLEAIGEDATEVELSEKTFSLLSTPCAGTA